MLKYTQQLPSAAPEAALQLRAGSVLTAYRLPPKLLSKAVAGPPGLPCPPGVRRGRDAPAAAQLSAVPTATSALRRG